MTDNGFLTPEFWSARTSVFLQFIVRPNEDAASAKLSMESCNASSESAISAHNHRRTETRAARLSYIWIVIRDEPG